MELLSQIHLENAIRMFQCDPGLCVYSLNCTFIFVLIIALKE